MTVGFLSSSGRRQQRALKKKQFDKLFLDTLLPHLSYEALHKLCQSNSAVAGYVQMRKSLIWYRKAFQFMQDCGYDSGITHVDDSNVFCATRAAYRTQYKNKVLSIEAGKARIVSWNVFSSPDTHCGTEMRFCLEFELMTSRRTRAEHRGVRFENLYRLSWTPEKEGAVPKLVLQVLLHDDGSLDVCQQRNTTLSPEPRDCTFDYIDDGSAGHKHDDSMVLDSSCDYVDRNVEKSLFREECESAFTETGRQFSLESYEASTFAQRCRRAYGKKLSSIALKGAKNDSMGSIRLLATFVSKHR